MSEPILSLAAVSKSYAGARALNSVSLDIFPGEVHGLVGENGAGKSTLIKILAGAVTPDSGTISFADGHVSRLDPKTAITHGISTVYQDVDLVTSLTVADNVFLGIELRTPWQTIDVKRQVEATRALLERLGVDLDPSAEVSNLSPAAQQTLQIVKALQRDARIVILDEPTASLGYEESVLLMGIVRQLIAEGIAVVYISHNLHEVLDLSARISVLKDGRRVNTYLRHECDANTLVQAMVGREASQYYVKPAVEFGPVRLRVRDLVPVGAQAGASFEVRAGEILGFGGLVGSGRTELMETLFGARQRARGEVSLDGKEIRPRTPREAIEQGICLLTEDRKTQAMFAHRSVLENVSVVRNELSNPWLRSERPFVEEMVDRLQIRLATVDQSVTSLSGGNQQKSMLARWLLTDADVFILDEPTKGVDIGAKHEIYGFMVEMAQRGKALIMVSSELPELLSLSDRIAVMRDGVLTTILPARELDEERLLTEFLGLEEAA